jgi:hypothetical protein
MGFFSSPEKEKRKIAEINAQKQMNEEFQKTQRAQQRADTATEEAKTAIAKSEASKARIEADKEIELENIQYKIFMSLPEEERVRLIMEKENEKKREEDNLKLLKYEIANADFYNFTMGNIVSKLIKNDALKDEKITGQIGFSPNFIVLKTNTVVKTMFSKSSNSDEFIIPILETTKFEIKKGFLDAELKFGTLGNKIPQGYCDSNGVISMNMKKGDLDKIQNHINLIKDNKLKM